MKRLSIFIFLLFAMAFSVSAEEFTAPPAPESVEDLVPVETESFGKALLQVIKNAIADLAPELAEAVRICASLVAVVMLTGILRQMPGGNTNAVQLAAILGISLLLFSGTGSLISLGTSTVTQISEYGKMLLPVLTAALAAQGAVSTSAALYAGTAAFDALLGSLIAKLLTPLVYVFLVLAIVSAATGEELIKKLQDFSKWLISWSLKTVLYIFTGYMGITGVVSGNADAAAIKATKLTISGMVPVVGGILSDASEAVIVGAGVMRSAVGVYGLIVVAAMWIGPFLQIGIQYVALKVTGGICSIFGDKAVCGLIDGFSTAMGLLLAMTGAVSFLLLISTVCLMRGVQ